MTIFLIDRQTRMAEKLADIYDGYCRLEQDERKSVHEQHAGSQTAQVSLKKLGVQTGARFTEHYSI